MSNFFYREMKAAIFGSEEYRVIKALYWNQFAKRSGVPLINHINKGIKLMLDDSATMASMKAFCIHPLIQSDEALRENIRMHLTDQPYVLILAMEYRRAANAYLCKPHTDAWTIDDLKLYVGDILPEVQSMLRADKLQNEKDFIQYHLGTHERSDQLAKYFKLWIEYLDLLKGGSSEQL